MTCVKAEIVAVNIILLGNNERNHAHIPHQTVLVDDQPICFPRQLLPLQKVGLAHCLFTQSDNIGRKLKAGITLVPRCIVREVGDTRLPLRTPWCQQVTEALQEGL